MRAARWLASPLVGTAGVIAGLLVISVPLRKLTSARPAAEVRAVPAVVSSTEIPAVLRIKLLAPAKRLLVKTIDGTVLLEVADMVAGESEHDVALRFTDDELVLDLLADFGDMEAETAVFLTVMPDGYEERSDYRTGSGAIEETLRFEWHHEHQH